MLRFTPILIPFLVFSNSVTIYNNDIAYVTEEEDISLLKGAVTLRYNNIPKSIIIDSLFPQLDTSYAKIVSFEFNEKKEFSKAILEANLNKKVSFFTPNKKLFRGVLKRTNPIVVESNKNYFTLPSINSLVFPSYPSEDILEPSLTLQVESKKALRNTIKLHYLMRDIRWSSNYIVNLKDKKLDLEAWVSLSNYSSKNFVDYNMSLVLGDIHNINDYIAKRIKRVQSYKKLDSVESALAEVPEIAEPKALDGAYIYKIPFLVTLYSNQVKKFSLFEAKNIPYKNYAQAHSFVFSSNNKKLFFNNIIEFRNNQESNLDRPLARGIIRVYKNDRYIGGEKIANTPKDEKVIISLGKDLDITGESKVVEYITKKNYQYIKKEYILANKSNKTKELHLQEELHSSYDINFTTTCENNCSYKQINPFIKEYKIELKPKSKYSFSSVYTIKKYKEKE